ncbi:SPOR domain-containing protein [Namhaeicola litoreus]|uniref:SPOR domain-containing protein n=1 Tax=Namhaeicola litoreus TaxID=1052145 RepID=A0ABW3Y2C7_9FLAO
MPYVNENDLTNLYNEVEKSKETIDALATALQEEEHKVSIIKRHRVLLSILSVLLLLLFIWSFLPKEERVSEEYLIRNNLSIIETDSLHNLQMKSTKFDRESSFSINNLPLVYSVQIGAYTSFGSNLISEDMAQMSEFMEDGMNKYALGKFSTYKEAFELRNDLKRMGFKDCFIIAKSYGEPINMAEALQLSGEKWIKAE